MELLDKKFTLKKNIESLEYVEYTEDNGATESQLNSHNNYTFTIPGSEIIYNVGKSYLHVRGKIAAAGNVPYTSGKAALVNSGWNFADQGKYKINGDEVETIEGPGDVHNVIGMIKYSDDYEKGQGKRLMWAPSRGNGEIAHSFQIDDLYPISATNVTQGYNIAEVNLSAANPHLIQIINAGTNVIANNDEIVLQYDGRDITVYKNKIYTSSITLRAEGTTPAGLKYTDAVVGDLIEFFVDGVKLDIPRIDNLQTTVRYIGDRLVVYDGNALADILGLGIETELIDTGFEERRRRCVIGNGYNTNQVFEMFLPLDSIFQFLKKYPIPTKGASHIFEFKKNSVSNMIIREADNLMSPNATQASLVRFTYMSVWVPKMKFYDKINLDYLTLLKNKSLSFQWDKYDRLRSQIFQVGTNSGSWDITIRSSFPKKVYLVFQKVNRLDSETGNNMVYDNLDIEEVFITMNSERFPEYPFKPDFNVSNTTDVNYMRSYNAYLSACGLSFNDDCRANVSYDEFKSLYPIFCFDLYQKFTGIFKNASNIQLKAYWRFRTNPATEYKIMAVWEEARDVNIDFIDSRLVKLH